MTIPLAALFPFPRHRRFILSAIRTWTIGVALLLAIAPARVQGQAQPSISVQSAGAGSNLLFQLNTQSNWFYTFQQSANFTNWGYAADYYASNTSLNWTNPIATNGTAAFFRVKVNAPNPAANTNYHSWANSVTINNGLVEAVIVPTIGRVQQFRFLGDTNNAFWEDPTLYGQSPSTNSYKGFGGNKAWPAPQYGWGWVVAPTHRFRWDHREPGHLPTASSLWCLRPTPGTACMSRERLSCSSMNR